MEMGKEKGKGKEMEKEKESGRTFTSSSGLTIRIGGPSTSSSTPNSNSTTKNDNSSNANRPKSNDQSSSSASSNSNNSRRSAKDRSNTKRVAVDRVQAQETDPAQLPSSSQQNNQRNNNWRRQNQNQNQNQNRSRQPNDTQTPSSSKPKTSRRPRHQQQQHHQHQHQHQHQHAQIPLTDGHIHSPIKQLSSMSINTTTSSSSASSNADDLLTVLMETLSNATYDCMICVEAVKQRQQVWHCKTCWAVFHLKCARQWAEKSTSTQNLSSSNNEERTWRCPGCNQTETERPAYYCFCEKVLQPPFNPYVTPHSCGGSCGGKRACSHPCPLPCHPGPCPPCDSIMPCYCKCGKLKIMRRCNEMSSGEPLDCGAVCGSPLKCGNPAHHCRRTCHSDDHETCSAQVAQKCQCGKSVRIVPCGQEKTSKFVCTTKCLHKFRCGVHKCETVCCTVHSEGEEELKEDDEKNLCPMDPKVVKHCPCGKMDITSRLLCTDPIPTCGNECGKVLPSGCGHGCKNPCHAGPCKPCSFMVSVPCRCTSTVISLPCGIANDPNNPIEPPECQEVCNHLRSCSKHRCNQVCCPALTLPKDIASQHPAHECPLPCNRLLSCKLHACPLNCHKGKCPTCINASFDELRCHCGRTVVYPPIACGTPPPKCVHPCVRRMPCGHATQPHPCHPDSESCPRCPIFVEDACACGKTVMKVPCFRAGRVPLNCGKVCDKKLSCGHSCHRFCHTGDCEDGSSEPAVTPTSSTMPLASGIGKSRWGPSSSSSSSSSAPSSSSSSASLTNTSGTLVCTALCNKKRLCGHKCTNKCHARQSNLNCDQLSKCMVKLNVACRCGHLVKDITCSEYQELIAVQLPAHNGPAAAETPVFYANKKVFLPCNDTCAIAERNRKLAEALGIEVEMNASGVGSRIDSNSAVNNSRLGFGYAERPAAGGAMLPSEFEQDLIIYAKSNSVFVCGIETTLADFVTQLNDGTTTSTNLYLPPMKKTHNQFVANFAKYYGLHSEVVDIASPKPSVIVRKSKEMTACVPSPLISAIAPSYVPSDSYGTVVDENVDSQKEEKKDGTNQQPVNALYLSNVVTGIDTRNLEILLEPIFISLSVIVTWYNDDDAFVMITSKPGSSQLDAMDVEATLKRLFPAVETKFLTNQFCKSAELVWVTRTGQVVFYKEDNSEEGDEKDSSSGQKLNGKGIVAETSSNRWDLLMQQDEEHEPTVPKMKKDSADEWWDE